MFGQSCSVVLEVRRLTTGDSTLNELGIQMLPVSKPDIRVRAGIFGSSWEPYLDHAILDDDAGSSTTGTIASSLVKPLSVK